jgi:hypothetical protein
MAKWRVECSRHKFFFPRSSGFNSPLMRISSPIGRSEKKGLKATSDRFNYD